MDILKDNSERILAIDYGEKRIGIAITDPLKMFSIPLATLNNNSTLWLELKKIINSYNIVYVIIGYPYKEDGSKTEIINSIEKFAEDFKKKFKISFEFIDERYSSAIAWEQIVKSVPSRKKRRDKALIDRNAAAVILEDYLKTLD